MRLSINKGDRGYKPKNICAQYDVFFNGQQVHNASVADEERGFITRLVRRPRPGGFVTVPVHSMGKVEIRLRDAE